MLHIPLVQTAIAGKTADILAKTLDTKVEIGRIDLGMLNRLVIDNTVIYDQSGKQMVKAARLAVKIDLLELLNGRISISSAQMFSTHFNLYRKDANTAPNFQFVIDALASNDPTSEKKPLNLAIESYIMRHCSVSYDQWDKPEKKGVLDPNHLRISGIGTYIMLHRLTDDFINLSVKRLSAREHSGLELSNLSFNLVAGATQCRLYDLTLQMPNSNIEVGHVTVNYRQGKDGKPDTNTITYTGKVNPSVITPCDLSALLPGLHSFQSKLNIDISVRGNRNRAELTSLNITSTSGELNIRANGWYNSTHPHPSWNLTIDDFHASAKTIEFLSKNIDGKDASIPKEIYRLGDISLHGKGQADATGHITGEATLTTGIGSADLSVTYNAQRQFKGTLTANNISLGTLLANNSLGNITTNVSFSGTLPKGAAPTVNAKGLIPRLTYNGYTYSDIDIDCSYKNSNMSGMIAINDPNLSLIAQGNFGNSASTRGKQAVIEAKIDHFRPSATRLSDKWGDAAFSASVNADFLASGVNDSKGLITINGFNMQSSTDSCHISQIQLRSGFDEQGHYLVMESDFGYAILTGHFNYTSLLASVKSQIGTHLPVLASSGQEKGGDNNFTLHALVNSTEWMQKLFGIPLEIRKPMLLRTHVEDSIRSLVVECDAPLFDYNGTTYRGAKVNLHSFADSLICTSAIEKLQKNGDCLSLNANCHAADNLLDASMKWANTRNMRGEINATSSFGKNDDGVTYAHVVVNPSKITIGEKTWNVHSSDILYTPKHIDINDFSVVHDKQHIIVNGTASASKSDSLSIELNDIDLGYILDLVNFHSVEFDGKLSGNALVVAPFGDMDANARLTVNDFLFEKGRMGVLDAMVNWNPHEGQIDIDAITNDGDDARTIIMGYVSPRKNHIDLAIRADSTHIDFMHSFTNSFISRIDGRAVGDVQLAGPLNAINLTGKLVVNGSAMIRPLNCLYTLDNDTLTLRPDEIEINNAVIRDAYGNPGYVNGFIRHKHLTRLSYELNVKADNMLAYDFHDFGNDTFYGTVYADGDIDIEGHSGYLKIEGDVTPRKNSTFVYNASTTDQIANQEFINWNDLTERQNNNAPATGSLNERYAYPSDMFFNFNINCTPEATIRLLMDSHTNDYITMNGNGMIRATYYNKGAFNMFGTFTLEHGTYGITIQNIIKKNFTFNEGGTFVFGGNPYDATLNLQAVYTVNGVSLSDLNVGNSFTNNTTKVNCLMNIGGVARNPQVSFDLDMPTVSYDEKQMIRSVLNSEDELNQQVVYLLGIGRFYPTGTNNSTTRDQSDTSLAMQSLLSGTISSQISSVLNTVIKNDNWNFGANISTGDEGWNNAEYEGTVNGRLLNNRLLINGQFGYRDNVNTANTNFIGDFDIRYLLFPNGNLAVKVYNQTNDRYFTKSSLNTQGVGIIMKKDFQSILDIFGKKKKKKEINSGNGRPD